MPHASLWPLLPGFSAHTAPCGIPSIPAQSRVLVPSPRPSHGQETPEMLRASGGLGGAGCSQVTDSRKESQSSSRQPDALPQSRGMFPQRCQCPWLPVSPQQRGRREARNYGGGPGTQPLERHPGDGEGTRAGLGQPRGRQPREGSTDPAPPRPSPPEPPPRPGSPSSASPCRGSSAESTVTAPRWAGRGSPDGAWIGCREDN